MRFFFFKVKEGIAPSAPHLTEKMSLKRKDTTNPVHAYLVSTSLDLLVYHQHMSNSDTKIPTTLFKAIPNQPQLYHQNQQTILAIVPLPKHTTLQTITSILLSSHQRPFWDMHCPRRPLLLAVHSSSSTYEQRDVHPGKLESPIRALHLHELPIAARRLVVHREWDYHSPLPPTTINTNSNTSLSPPAFVLSETPAPPFNHSVNTVPFTNVAIPAPYTIGWVVLPTSATTYALVAIDDISLGGWLPSSIAFDLRQRMLLHRLAGISSCCKMALCARMKLGHASISTHNDNNTHGSTANTKGGNTPRKSATVATASSPNKPQLYPTIADIEPHHYLAPISRTVSLLAFAPQLLNNAADSYGPIERFKYAIAAFVAGMHTTVATSRSTVVSPLSSSTLLNINNNNNSDSTVTFQLTPRASPNANTTDETTSLASSSPPSPSVTSSSSARLRLHVPKPTVVEFLMTSDPVGSFEVGGSWNIDLSLPVTGVEGTTWNMTGECIVSFADSSHIEVTVLNGDTMRFEDPSHLLTCHLDLAGGEDGESLEGVVLHDGSAVSTVLGTWKTSLLFDNWECWHQGQHETVVKVVVDCEEEEEEEEGEGEERK